jgi:phosphopantothenoylcysteine synthetase/decarboxylase
VANDVARPGVGFGGPDNAVVVVGAEGVVADVGPVTKRKVAEMLFDLVVQRAKPRRQQS